VPALITTTPTGTGVGRNARLPYPAGSYIFEPVLPSPPPLALPQTFAVAYFKSFAIYHTSLPFHESNHVIAFNNIAFYPKVYANIINHIALI